MPERVVAPPPCPCPPGTIPRLDPASGQIVCIPGIGVIPLGGPASGISVAGRFAVSPSVAPCLRLRFQGTIGPPFFYDVLVACAPVLPGTCVRINFSSTQNVGISAKGAGFRLTPPNPITTSTPRSQFAPGHELILHQEDVVLGSRYVAEQNNLLRTFTLTKNGVPVGTLISSGTFINGPNIMGTPVNQIFPSVMFPGSFAVIHGSQIAEFNSVGALVANRLLQFVEQPISNADFTEVIGSITFCNRSAVAVPVDQQIAQLEVRGQNFTST